MQAKGINQVEDTWDREIDALLNTYLRLPVENSWHVGTISYKKDSEKKALQWKNEAGVSWALVPNLQKNILITDRSNPYYENGAREFKLEIRDGQVVGFWFNNELYAREGFDMIPQLTGGLKGYISMSVKKVPDEYGYGVSFYTSAWPLLDTPLSAFQIGLPSTWIIPDNRDFEQPLCPPGTVARDNWPERGPYYRDVFQTIEGGLGYWCSTQFPSVVPKYRMNGTSNGYNHEISSPGWGFGRTKALSDEQVGIAQLSNRLIVPPDGITFKKDTNGEILGNAWMALPFTEPNDGPIAPTGDLCWTLFLNTSNFKGPVAFWIPETWSRLSSGYKTIVGRGLDNRSGLMNGGAMEVNTVPYFENNDAAGTRYSKIPRLNFPVNKDGITTLMQDVTMYSQEALYLDIKSWIEGGDAPAGQFGHKAAYTPEVRSNPISFRQGKENIPLTGFDNIVETEIFGSPGALSFGLRWMNEEDKGIFPEYYKQEGQKMVATPAAEVPSETGLVSQSFRPGNVGKSYTSPEERESSWNTPGPQRGPYKVALSDGSEVTYSWYRFIDQPSLQKLGWSEEKKERLQSLVEEIHAKWLTDRDYMPPPSSGTLVELDPAILVNPPEGLEVGYVPIVTLQRK